MPLPTEPGSCSGGLRPRGSGAYLGMDVELGNDTIGNPYLNYGGKANDGTQFAELNAEKVGTLYQDVLTAPGATLSCPSDTGAASTPVLT